MALSVHNRLTTNQSLRSVIKRSQRANWAVDQILWLTHFDDLRLEKAP